MEWMPPPDGDHRLRGCQAGAIDLQQEPLEGSLTQGVRVGRVSPGWMETGPSRYCSATPTSKTPCGISVDIDDALTLAERTEI